MNSPLPNIAAESAKLNRRAALSLRHPLREVRLGGGPASPRTGGAALAEGAVTERERAAFERGRKEEEKKRDEKWLREQAELLERQKALLKSLETALCDVGRYCNEALTALCLEVAQKAIAGLPISAEMVEAVLREALTQVQGAAHIYLNPADLELLQNPLSPLLDEESNSQPLHFHAAREVTRGGCIVKTQFGTIDARRETKFALLKQSLLK